MRSISGIVSSFLPTKRSISARAEAQSRPDSSPAASSLLTPCAAARFLRRLKQILAAMAHSHISAVDGVFSFSRLLNAAIYASCTASHVASSLCRIVFA